MLRNVNVKNIHYAHTSDDVAIKHVSNMASKQSNLTSLMLTELQHNQFTLNY